MIQRQLDRNPRSNLVTTIAGIFRRNMRLALAHGINIVVARKACRHAGLCVIELGNRFPGSRCVAAFANISRVQMLASNRQLAGGIDAVVTGYACRRANVGVVEGGLPGGEGRVASFTGVVRRDMVWRIGL